MPAPSPSCCTPCWRPATASASKATTRSRPTSWPAPWSSSILSRCTTCTWCSRCWRCRSTWMCLKTASRGGWTSASPARQGARLAKLVSARQLEIGAIHTYLELFARYFVDLTPKVALVAAHAADAQGNLYTGPNTEDTPAIVEATAFSGRHRHRPGQRDGGWHHHGAAARGHSLGLGAFRRGRRPGPTSSSRCSRATRPRSAKSRC